MWPGSGRYPFRRGLVCPARLSPWSGAEFPEAGEGVDGLPAFPFLPADPQMLHGAQLLNLLRQALHLPLQLLDGPRQPDVNQNQNHIRD